MKKIIVLALIIFTGFAGVAFAKNKSTENPSIQLLKSLTEEGTVIRKEDVLVEKADVSKDTLRVQDLKNLYTQDYNTIKDVGNPEILKYSGIQE